MSLAPEKFALWTSINIANDRKFGREVFRYHPRSDEHSKMICRLVLEDLLAACPVLQQHVDSGQVVCGINVRYRFSNAKRKTLDRAIGVPDGAIPAKMFSDPVSSVPIGALRFACEAKQTMTEHSKSKPRLFDELSSSHEIVHQGDPTAIAAGIVVVNIADRFASPLRQTSGDGPLVYTTHRQPDVTRQVVEHLRGLIVRDTPDTVGFDAFTTIVVNCDNTGPCTLHTAEPAPQPGDRDHYETFLQRISCAYADRYGR